MTMLRKFDAMKKEREAIAKATHFELTRNGKFITILAKSETIGLKLIEGEVLTPVTEGHIRRN